MHSLQHKKIARESENKKEGNLVSWFIKLTLVNFIFTLDFSAIQTERALFIMPDIWKCDEH